MAPVVAFGPCTLRRALRLMLRQGTSVSLTGIVCLAAVVLSSSSRTAAGQDPSVSGPGLDQRVVRAALALVPPERHRPVVIIDPEATGDPETIGRLDAFIVRERDGRLRPKIYLNLRSTLLEEARQGDDFSVKVLAAVLVHEAVHLDGGTEDQARVAEASFFDDLVRRRLVARHAGRRYSELLRRRPADGPGHVR